ncbi:hypothetical protein PVL29_023939 [Vitis rotundifolia]|uniref:Uncharacterized protein n=1 Tax=Vitis rotundifolia TaxID=103349 RepID=A0AA39D7G0_VITRO|nr:hypothetical protein PVL29_023939 [Vitis rotundifolia]
MTTNLRTNFKERQRKCLFEPIAVAREEPATDIPPMPMPPADATGSSSAQAATSLTKNKRLEVIEAMRAFITQRIGGSEELRAKLEWVESNLAAV